MLLINDQDLNSQEFNQSENSPSSILPNPQDLAGKFLPQIPTVTLNNGMEMPMLGFGTYKLEGENCIDAVLCALETGYRCIDTAALYLNEVELGQALKQTQVPREQILVQSKLWVHGAQDYQTTRAHVFRTLEAMQLDYLDIFLLHQPYNNVYAAWEALEDLVAQGYIKALGLSNFPRARIQDLITFKSRILPVLNQIEFSPQYQRNQLLPYYQEHNINLQAWSPLAKGADRVFTNAFLHKLAEERDCTVAQVIIRWFIDMGVSLHIKSQTPARIRENFQIPAMPLTPEDIVILGNQEMAKTGSTSLSHTSPLFVDKVIGRIAEIEDYYQAKGLKLDFSK